MKKDMDDLQYAKEILHNIPTGIMVCEKSDRDTIKFCNRGFTRLTGYTLEEMDERFQRSYSGLFDLADQNHMKKRVELDVDCEDGYEVEYRIRNQCGHVVWILERGRIFVCTDGTEAVQCLLIDITKHKLQEEALLLSEKRYEIAMRASGITMFEYDVITKDLILYEDNAKMYGVASIIPNGVETFVSTGIIEASSADDYIEMYRKIHAGEPFAQCYVKTRDKQKRLHDYELSLTNVFDTYEQPIRAIGVRKNVSALLHLQKEQEYGKNLLSGHNLIFEADITMNSIEHINELWKERYGITEDMLFSTFLEQNIQNYVIPEHQSCVKDKLSPEYIQELYNKGESLITFEYKRRETIELCYVWHEAIVNIIRDQMTDNTSIRMYTCNIEDTKRKEQRALDEQRLYEAMRADSQIAYEVNITQNKTLSGTKDWEYKYGILVKDNYSEMIQKFGENIVHPEDKESFLNAFGRNSVLDAFANGKRQVVCQYRRGCSERGYMWASCAFHLYEEPESRDVRGFAYIQDIDEQKKKEISLKFYAEHDSMTGVYNKFVTEQKIQEYLDSEVGSQKKHALFIVDIDYFKQINDTFGHLAGDAVIKEVVETLCAIFRKGDIIGRVGGDEFCIFIKNIVQESIVEEKALEICKKLVKTIEEDGKVVCISASVGVAFYPSQGKDFQSLFRAADGLLYQAKENGRNRYEFLKRLTQ